MSDFLQKLRENYESVEGRIQRACERAFRDRSEVTLVAVTKYAKWEWVEALFELGQRDFGENRPQQFLERAPLLSSFARWHLIGHLQSNKAKSVVTYATQFDSVDPLQIHSIDSLKLLELIDRLAAEFQTQKMPPKKENSPGFMPDLIADSLQLRPNLLLEINVTGEATKYGFTPDELRSQWDAVLRCQHISIRGLMTMAMASDDPDTARPAFRALRDLRDELQTRSPYGKHPITELSMGMTGDFEVAIEEGATFVRIGSALFEGLD
ncbi:MAG: hypothetical protein JWN70_2182 [Planctomycetaceae bacterium]|nr:hypothetical protein [Planctomycetaceae bacterium]